MPGKPGGVQREGRAPGLRKSRWLVLKSRANLRGEQHFRLRDLLRYNLKTVRAYLLSRWKSWVDLGSGSLPSDW